MERDLVDGEDVVMFVSGSTLEVPGRTSTLEILRIEDVLDHLPRA